MFAGAGGEGLVGALQYALRADIDPGAGRHLAVHHQALLLQLVEAFPVGPVAHQVGVGDDDARRILVRAQHPDRLAALHQQRLVVLQFAQGFHYGVIAGPVPGRFAAPAVDHQFLGALGHLRVQVVHQHAQGGLLLPAFARKFIAARGAYYFRSHLSSVNLPRNTRPARPRLRPLCGRKKPRRP